MSGSQVLANGLSLEEVGSRIRRMRQARGLGISALAAACGVSSSMISEVERGAKTPTVLVLDRIATALGSSIARLLDEPSADRVVVLRRGDQRVVSDPSGWERRVLSPVVAGVEFEFMCTTIGAGVDAGEFSPHSPGSREYVAVERGELVLTLDGQRYLLAAGDAVYYEGDCRHAFANVGTAECVYYLAMEVSPTGGKQSSHDRAGGRS